MNGGRGTNISHGTRLGAISSFALIVLAVWLGWQVVRELATDRLPPSLALRLSPGSSAVLGRAAEVEFAGKRFNDAERLARSSLRRAAFNVRALRILGLTEAEKGNDLRADDILTLSGNWSLRDDPSQVWLMRYRLARGDYSSAFAHADTLTRRRPDIRPELFGLFTTAATLDTRAVPAVAALLVPLPPWRADYLSSLNQTDEGIGVAANLAVILQNSQTGQFSSRELSSLYVALMQKGRIQALSELRRRLNRPDRNLIVVNGEFAPPSQSIPFDWRLFTAPGGIPEILPDDLRHNDSALRVRYNSFGSRVFVEQLLLLGPGPHRLSGQRRVESGVLSRVSWTVTCFESQQAIVDTRDIAGTAVETWQSFSTNFIVPSHGCTAQWLRLTPHPGDRRESITLWYDRLSVSALKTGSG